MAGKYTIHESEIAFKSLPGRKHKMIIGPNNFRHCKNMCFGIAEFPPESHAPEHIHNGEEEIIYILRGYGHIYFDGKPENVEPGTCIYIPCGVRHSIENMDKNVMCLVYVFSPPVIQGSYDKK